MNNKLKLNPGEIHIWAAFPGQIQDKKLLTIYKSMMNQEEKARHKRFHFSKHRHKFLITRALVRTTLSRYWDIDPKNWQFSKNKYGRPEIILPPGMPPVRFNLSHTDGLVVCGIALEYDIGVDVENTGRSSAASDIAKRYFTSSEVQDIFSVPEEKQAERFFYYWTLKEAYIKARGMGLSLPLEQFSFDISDISEKGLSISFDPQLKDDPVRWQFWLFKLTPAHCLAVSICRETIKFNHPSFIKTVPLAEEQQFFPETLSKSSNSDISIHLKPSLKRVIDGCQ